MKYLAIFLMSVMIWACERSHVTDIESQNAVCLSDVEIRGMYNDADSLWMFSVRSDLSEVYDLYWMLNGQRVVAFCEQPSAINNPEVLSVKGQSWVFDGAVPNRSADFHQSSLADVSFRMSKDVSNEVCIVYNDGEGCHQSCITILPEVLVVDTRWYLAYDAGKATWILQNYQNFQSAF